MTTNRSLSEAVRGPGTAAQVNTAVGVHVVLGESRSGSPTGQATSTEYIQIAPPSRRAVVSSDLSPMERILVYLKALYR
jgi:hypothetical protein